MHPDPELVTSRFSAGARSAGLTALRQRSRQKVKGQFLDPIQNSSTSQTERISSAHFGDTDMADRAARETNLDDQVCRLLEEARTLLETKREIDGKPEASSEPRLLVTTMDAAGDHVRDQNRSCSTTNPDPTVAQHNDGCRERLDVQDTSAQQHGGKINQTNDDLRAARKRSGPARPCETSSLEDARRSLRQLQRRKKIVDENLDSLRRASAREALNSHLDALTSDDAAEKLWIIEAVDTIIARVDKEIQEELSSEERGEKPARGAKTRTDRCRERPRAASRQQGDESHLTHLYGRPPHVGARRTLKQNPYLRLSSPVRHGHRKQRPLVVESVKGVKVKSCKTQTSLLRCPSEEPPDDLHSSRLTSAGRVQTRPDDFSEVVAIPLGPPIRTRPWTCRRQETRPPSPQSHLTHLYGRPPDVGSGRTPKHNPYLPLSPPVCHKKQRPLVVEIVKGPPVRTRTCRRQETSPVRQETRPPSPQVNQEKISRAEEHEEPSVKAEQLRPPSIRVHAHEGEVQDGGEDQSVFPGTEFLHVGDIEEESVESEKVLLVDGAPSPEPVEYQGPVFPPRTLAPPRAPAPPAAPADPLVERWAEWVEQQVMFTMISEMVQQVPADPTLKVSSDPTLKVSSDPSELEESDTSDIEGAAEVSDLQLFLDSNQGVDSALIRRLAEEVLGEIISETLARTRTPDPEPERDRPDPGPPPQERVVALLPTPVPTPPASPGPQHREDTHLSTPTPSERASLEEEPQQTAPPADAAATPTPSPEPTPSPVPAAAPTWEDAELPLDEERPEETPDTQTHALVMSVAQEEEEPSLSSPHPRSPSPAAAAEPASPPVDLTGLTGLKGLKGLTGLTGRSECSSSSSSDFSCSTVTPTEALNPISEGELLISVNQLSMTGEDIICSTSSSLLDIDFDPPSEGQVKGHALRPTEMQREVLQTPRGERPQPEGSWGRDEDPSEGPSVGEVREDWTLGTMDPVKPGSSSAAAQSASSPGQVSQCPDEPVSLEETHRSSMNVGDLTVDLNGTLTSEQHDNTVDAHVVL